MTPTRELLEAALQGFDIQRKAIEAKQSAIREALKSPVQQVADAIAAVKPFAINPTHMVISPAGQDFLSKLEKRTRTKRKMSAAGRAAISKATKARWAKYRKEQKRA